MLKLTITGPWPADIKRRVGVSESKECNERGVGAEEDQIRSRHRKVLSRKKKKKKKLTITLALRTINPEYFPILISFPRFWGEVQGAGRTETSSNQDRIATRRGRIDAAWESQKRKKGIGRRIYCRARETTGGLNRGNRREKRRGGPGRKSSKKRGLKRRKRCEAEGMTELVAMATLSGERSPDGRA